MPNLLREYGVELLIAAIALSLSSLWFGYHTGRAHSHCLPAGVAVVTRAHSVNLLLLPGDCRIFIIQKDEIVSKSCNQ
jgi:hypothetical protein